MHEQDIRTILKDLYKEVWAFSIPKEDDLNVRRAKSSSLYGEITFASLEKLYEYLELGNTDVFFDLGSGVGKVVAQTALMTPVKKAIGIELSETRHKDAQKVRQKLIKLGLLDADRFQLICGDILQAKLDKATVIYTCSTAFPDHFMRALERKLAQLKQGVRLVTTRALLSEDHFSLEKKLSLDMSWSRKTPVRVYRLTHPIAP